MSAGGQDERNAQYGPFTPGFIRVPHCLEYRKHEQDGAPVENYGEWAANQIEDVILREGADTVGALCLEPVTAGGGVIEAPEGYWPRVARDLQEIRHPCCTSTKLFVAWAALARGSAIRHYGIKPDIVSMAKGVASGYAAISCLCHHGSGVRHVQGRQL